MKKSFFNLIRLIFLMGSVILGYSIVKKLKEKKLEQKTKFLVKKPTQKVVKKVSRFIEEEKTSILTFRQQKILNIMKSVQIVDMKSLQVSIKGVTERTLRRDLLELQKVGLIKKIGNTKSVKYQLLNQ